MSLHVNGDEDVLGAVVASKAAGEAMASDGLVKQVEDRLAAVVAAHTNSGDEARLAVDKTVNDNFEPNQT